MTADSYEQMELEAEISRIQAQLDSRSPEERATDIIRMRSALTRDGITITSEDEKVFLLFVEGVLDSRHLADHFRPRVVATGEKDR